MAAGNVLITEPREGKGRRRGREGKKGMNHLQQLLFLSISTSTPH